MFSWISHIFHNIYVSPMDRIHWAMFLLPAGWLILSNLTWISAGARKAFCFLCLLATVVSSLVILYMTVLGRGSGTREIYLIPFYSFREARQRPEFYRQLTMNVFLFEPPGLAAPFAAEYILTYILSKNSRSRRTASAAACAGFGLLFCAALSVLIEVCQCVFALGRAETDDLIMNLLGASVGTGTYALHIACGKLREGALNNRSPRTD